MVTKHHISIVSLLCSFILFLGCGVKGSPVPPEQSPSIGRGQPTFKDAVKEVSPVKIQQPKEGESELEDE